jgi:hypothetical protein
MCVCVCQAFNRHLIQLEQSYLDHFWLASGQFAFSHTYIYVHQCQIYVSNICELSSSSPDQIQYHAANNMIYTVSNKQKHTHTHKNKKTISKHISYTLIQLAHESKLEHEPKTTSNGSKQIRLALSRQNTNQQPTNIQSLQIQERAISIQLRHFPRQSMSKIE